MNNYKYSGIALSPQIIAELCIELFSGKIISRKDIIKTIPAEHLKRGGIQSKSENITSAIKKALQNLKKLGLADNPGLAQWKFQANDLNNKIENVPIEKPTIKESKKQKRYAEKIIGEGEECVYIYYLEAYKKLALINSDKVWECKIGMSEADPIDRILSQASTALPERPVIGLIIKTNEARQLEKVFHSILTFIRAKKENIPGQEWYITSPDKVEEIYNLIMNL
jgi:hypothetical protein